MYTPLPHGPDGPPPDDGYAIKDYESGNFLGKLGVLCVGVGLVTGVLYLTASSEAENKMLYRNSTFGLVGSGVGFIVLERVF